MEGKIAAEIGMDNRITLCPLGGIDRLHTSIETQHEKVQIEAQPQSVCHRNLLIELVKAELTSGLVLVIAQRPDVSGIDKHRAPELPEQAGAIFDAGIELDVACLIQEIAVAGERTRS